MTNVSSNFNSSIYWSVLTYGTLIKDNTFSHNFAGMKGTALLLDKINELQIIDNTFMNNGPVTAYHEIQFSPYHNYVNRLGRTFSFHL